MPLSHFGTRRKLSITVRTPAVFDHPIAIMGRFEKSLLPPGDFTFLSIIEKLYDFPGDRCLQALITFRLATYRNFLSRYERSNYQTIVEKDLSKTFHRDTKYLKYQNNLPQLQNLSKMATFGTRRKRKILLSLLETKWPLWDIVFSNVEIPNYLNTTTIASFPIPGWLLPEYSSSPGKLILLLSPVFLSDLHTSLKKLWETRFSTYFTSRPDHRFNSFPFYSIYKSTVLSFYPDRKPDPTLSSNFFSIFIKIRKKW